VSGEGGVEGNGKCLVDQVKARAVLREGTALQPPSPSGAWRRRAVSGGSQPFSGRAMRHAAWGGGGIIAANGPWQHWQARLPWGRSQEDGRRTRTQRMRDTSREPLAMSRQRHGPCTRGPVYAVCLLRPGGWTQKIHLDAEDSDARGTEAGIRGAEAS
jgi:hypothetical protein